MLNLALGLTNYGQEIEITPPDPNPDNLILEGGDDLLLEDGDLIVKEN